MAGGKATVRIRRAQAFGDQAQAAEIAGAASAEAAYQAVHEDEPPLRAGRRSHRCRVLRRRQHDDAGRIDLPFRPRLGRPRTSSPPGICCDSPCCRSSSGSSARTPEDTSNAREGALAFVAGRQVSQIVELGEEIYDELMADKIYPRTRELAQRHLDAGQRVWLVTATPVELAQIIGRRLGLTGALGTVAEQEDGVYTGRLFGETAARPGEGSGGPLAGRPGGPRPAPMHRLLGFGERRADAVGGRHRGGDQPGRRAAGRRAGARAGRSRTSAPAARRRSSGPRRWSAPEPSVRRCWSAGRSGAGAASGGLKCRLQ